MILSDRTIREELDAKRIAIVARLPATVYPGMNTGRIGFLEMTTPAEPYSSAGLGSKYQGQRGPTPCRYFENFKT